MLTLLIEQYENAQFAIDYPDPIEAMCFNGANANKEDFGRSGWVQFASETLTEKEIESGAISEKLSVELQALRSLSARILRTDIVL